MGDNGKMFSSYSVSWWEPNKGIDIFLGKKIKPKKTKLDFSIFVRFNKRSRRARWKRWFDPVCDSFVCGTNRNRSRPTGRRDGHITIGTSPCHRQLCAFVLLVFLFFSFLNSTHANCICSKWYDCWLPVCVCVCVCRSGHSSEIASNKLVEHAGRATVHLLARQPLSPAKCIRHHWQQGERKKKNNRVMRTFAAIS